MRMLGIICASRSGALTLASATAAGAIYWKRGKGAGSRCRLPNLPECGNYLAGTCERSSVYISKETDGAFVITCLTCNSVNVWPKDRDENLGRYENHMKHIAARQAQTRYELSRPAYSFSDQWRK